MTSRDRMLCALARQKPDRLPATIHQWQPYHLARTMGGVGALEAFAACGLDASLTVFETFEEDSPHWRVGRRVSQTGGGALTAYRIATPEGELTAAEQSDEMTTWVTEPLIKRPEDILLLQKYRPIPALNRKALEDARAALGDGGILRTFLWGRQGGCWQDACELFGTQNLIFAAIDDPDWVHAFLRVLLEQKLAFIEKNMAGLPVDLVETGGGAASNTVISPAMHEAFALPYDKVLHGALHGLGYPVVYHTCGGMRRITAHILQNGCDASETLSPAGVGGDIGDDCAAREVYRALRGRVALIGGMDQINLLENGEPAAVADEVGRLFSLFGSEGGYIASASDHFFTAPVANLKAFADAARACVY